MKINPARPLSSVERTMLDLLLASDFAGVEQLRVQARAAGVVRRCDCGCPTIDLLVPADVPAARLDRRLLASEGDVAPIGDDLPGEIILFTDDGRLSGSEYVYFDAPPRRGQTRAVCA